MEQIAAAHAFATLGHPDRLAVFRLLMRFAPRGVRPTEIAQTLGFKPNTLSHHLADLTAAGLVGVERQGRSLHYSVALDRAQALIGYLALDVGRGRPD
ncbi:MAG: helix-turn-helix transcriptional regulator, partial [Rhodobacteraceae bacterium]|nr:helix-turn-helix transcriptional regulator [Paracoccaceae bacterium]